LLLRSARRQLSAIIGDRPASSECHSNRARVGYGGKTINTLRLWAARAPHYFDFQVFSHGDFVGAVAETLTAESLTRVLYPDDSTSIGQGLRFVQEYFLVAARWPDLLRRSGRATPIGLRFRKVAIQLNDTHPRWVPELMRILLDEAKLGWDEAWDLTQRTLAYTNHTLLPEALEKWPLEWFGGALARQWRSFTRSIVGCSSRPFLQGFGQECVIRIRQSPLGEVPRPRPAQLGLIEQNPHQLGTAIVGCVSLSCMATFSESAVQSGLLLPETPQEVGPASRRPEILLHEAQSLADARGVVG